MKIFKKAGELREFLKKETKEKALGFVPTMGALHDGHASLIARSVDENCLTVVSIFVNPTQFLPSEDLAKYPRTLKRDLELCERLGVDCVFVPDVDEIYYELDFKITPDHRLTSRFEGEIRPSHFDGVCGVVLRLLNLIAPNRAYFGKKDFQQLLIIEHMARALFLPTKIIACETIRESDGLALSSRNVYLSQESREKAPALYAALKMIECEVARGELLVAKLLESSAQLLSSIDLDYFEIVDFNLEPIEKVKLAGSVALIAGKIAGDKNSPRLLDNLCL